MYIKSTVGADGTFAFTTTPCISTQTQQPVPHCPSCNTHTRIKHKLLSKKFVETSNTIAIILHFRNTNTVILYTIYTALRNGFELQ
jgi:hypothetical protein